MSTQENANINTTTSVHFVVVVIAKVFHRKQKKTVSVMKLVDRNYPVTYNIDRRNYSKGLREKSQLAYQDEADAG